MHEQWLVGENEIRQHYVEHMSTKTLATMSNKELQVTCPFCYVNQNLTPLERAKNFTCGALKLLGSWTAMMPLPQETQ
jgi:galactose-1-phosphate uridylyltransferase